MLQPLAVIFGGPSSPCVVVCDYCIARTRTWDRKSEILSSLFPPDGAVFGGGHRQERQAVDAELAPVLQLHTGMDTEQYGTHVKPTFGDLVS